MSGVHESAIIEKGAEVYGGVEVGEHSIIRGGARVGEGNRIGVGVEIRGGVELGSWNEVGKGVILGSEPQDKGFEGGLGYGLRIGSKNIFKEYVTVSLGVGRRTEVGDGNYFMVGSHIGHDCRVGFGNILVNYSGLGGWVEVGDRAYISGHSLIHQRVRVGDLAMIGGLSRVLRDVVPYGLVEGGELRGLNLRGLRSAGWSRVKIWGLKKAYGGLFGARSLKEGMEWVRWKDWSYEGLGEELGKVIGWIEKSKRGVLKFKEA